MVMKVTRKRSAALAAVLSWGIAPGAYAQETDAECMAFAEAALGLLSEFDYVADPFEARFDPDEETCVIKDLTLAGSGGMDISVGRVLLSGEGVERMRNGLPPLSLEASIYRVRPYLGRGMGPSSMQYVSRVQAKSYSGAFAHLSYDWSAETKRVDNFGLTFGRGYDESGNEIGISADIRGVDLTDWASIQTSLGSMRLHYVSINMTLFGVFEQMVVPWAVPGLLEDHLPIEEQVEMLKTVAVDYVTELPPAVFDEASRAGLAEIVKTLPHPRGYLSVQFASEPGLGTASFVPFAINGTNSNLGGIWQILENSASTVTIDWEPDEE
jgi:hypothetical protein